MLGPVKGVEVGEGEEGGDNDEGEVARKEGMELILPAHTRSTSRPGYNITLVPADLLLFYLIYVPNLVNKSDHFQRASAHM